MKLKNVLYKAVACVLAFAIFLSSGQIVAAAPTNFPAAFNHSGSAYLVNGNFDGTDNFVTGGNAKGQWFLYKGTSGEVTKELTQVNSGTASMKITGSGSAVDQRVELKPNTEYVLSVWVYAEGSEGARVRAFLNGGGEQSDKKLVDTDVNCQGKWYKYENAFTTSADTIYADVGVVRAHGDSNYSTSGTVYVDDFEIREADAPLSATRIDAETIQVEYPDTRDAAPIDSDISLSCSVNGAPSETLDVSVAWDSGQHMATVTHDNVSKGSETTADFELQASGEIFTQTVKLAANPNYVGPEIERVSELQNGSAILTLKQAPTRDLTAGEIGISYRHYDGQPATLSVANLQKRSDTEYFIEFGSIAPRETDMTYTLTFEIGGASVNGDLTVATTSGKTFYLDATNGNDNNDGTSPEQAWQSLDKVNNTEFMAGSSLLLKSGEIWKGTLAPKGSGKSGDPIILSSYGEGNRPRIVMDDSAEYEETLMRVAAERTRQVNETFRLYNQSWWEISNIEFHNPNYEENTPWDSNRAFERGMYIMAKDVGQLDHIYIDNVYIHGFQSPDSSNGGKESGGIIFMITTDKETANRKETRFNDISVTNCTIEDVGRSGFFLLSPWKTRDMTADRKWGGRWQMVNNAGEGSLGAFTPSTNIYIGKNIFRNISGDGIILQCMDGVVAEYNLVDETCTGNSFAAGIFPYLVSNGTVQYNELCRTHWGGDAEGVEIDALNENFAVLYNYSHHNSGGFVQFCTPVNLPSYDSYYAYNISENDGTYGPRPNSNSLIMPLAAAINCSVFNNTIYFDPFPAQDNNGADRFFNDNSSNVQSVAIYNNIFYRGGNAYQFNSKEINYFNNSMQSLADNNVVPNGGNTRFANNLFYNFDVSSINPDSAFYQDNIWGVDPKLASPGRMGDGNPDALLKENDITKAWNLDAYKLAEDSPAIGAGRAIRTEYADIKDMLGNTVDAQKPDLGAIQYTPPVDKSSLQTLTNTSEQYYNQMNMYTPETARVFKAAYEEALRVLADTGADEATVKAAYAALEAAVRGLVEQGTAETPDSGDPEEPEGGEPEQPDSGDPEQPGGGDTPDFRPVITDGADGVWKKESGEGLSFRSDAEYADFVKVQVDGRDVDAANYEVREGSTIVTLKESYLETLSGGVHTLAIVSQTGTAETTFTIQQGEGGSSGQEQETPSDQNGNTPQGGGSETPKTESGTSQPDSNTSNTSGKAAGTGDNSRAALWGILALLASACSAKIVLMRRRKIR